MAMMSIMMPVTATAEEPCDVLQWAQIGKDLSLFFTEQDPWRRFTGFGFSSVQALGQVDCES